MATELGSLSARPTHSQLADKTPHERAPRSCYEKVKDFFSSACNPPAYSPRPLTDKLVKQLRCVGWTFITIGLGYGGYAVSDLISDSKDRQLTTTGILILLSGCAFFSAAAYGARILIRVSKSPRQNDPPPLPEENL